MAKTMCTVDDGPLAGEVFVLDEHRDHVEFNFNLADGRVCVRTSYEPAQVSPSSAWGACKFRRMSDEASQAPGLPAQRPIMLSAWARRAALVVALLTLGLGATAVFRTDNQAGSAALLAVSVGLMIVGLLGRIPERGTVGQIAYTFGPIADGLDSPDQVEREKAAEVLLQNAEEHVGSLEPNAQAVTHAAAIVRRQLQRAMVEVVARLANEMGLTVVSPPSPEMRVLNMLIPDLRIGPGSTGEQFVPFPVEIRNRADLMGASQAARFAEVMGARTAVLITPDLSAEVPDAITIAGVQVFVVAVPRQGPGPDLIQDGLRRAVAHSTAVRG